MTLCGVSITHSCLVRGGELSEDPSQLLPSLNLWGVLPLISKGHNVLLLTQPLLFLWSQGMSVLMLMFSVLFESCNRGLGCKEDAFLFPLLSSTACVLRMPFILENDSWFITVRHCPSRGDEVSILIFPVPCAGTKLQLKLGKAAGFLLHSVH